MKGPKFEASLGWLHRDFEASPRNMRTSLNKNSQTESPSPALGSRELA